MKSIKTLLSLALCSIAICANAQRASNLLGGDISMLPVYEQNNVAYIDKNNITYSDVLQLFGNYGWNAERVRLFVDPYSGVTHDAMGAIQTLDYVKALGKRIKDHGQSFMLDFHYSDTWTDPGKHSLPKSWEGQTVEQLKTTIYNYTKDCLTQLVDAGAAPDLIQTGNEITTGMLWPTGNILTDASGNWPNLAEYLKQAIQACNDVCPNAKIVLHTELHNINSVTTFYNNAKFRAIPYDVIGLSYYPDYHGDLSVLGGLITKLETLFADKEIMIVETGYGYKWALPGPKYDFTKTWPLSEAGQKKFTTDLITLLNSHEKVTGLYWWYPEDNGNGVKLDGEWLGWWNAALFDHETGQAFAAFYELIKFRGVEPTGIKSIDSRPSTLDQNAPRYNLAGQKVSNSYKGVVVQDGKKIVVK